MEAKRAHTLRKYRDIQKSYHNQIKLGVARWKILENLSFDFYMTEKTAEGIVWMNLAEFESEEESETTESNH